jgi:hypothetical protein
MMGREQLDNGTRIISDWTGSLNAESGTGTMKELSVQDQFLIRIFGECLGYTTQSAGR